MKTLYLVFTLNLLILPAKACTCIWFPISNLEKYFQYDIIFKGRLISIDTIQCTSIDNE